MTWDFGASQAPPIETPTVPRAQLQYPLDLQSIEAIKRSLEETSTFKTIQLEPGEDIQGTIDKLDQEGGGTVLLAAGTYNLASDIVGKDRVSIVGAGVDKTIIDFNENSNSLKYEGALGSILEGFAIIGMTIRDSNASTAVNIDFCDNWIIRDVVVTSNNTDGITFNNSQDFSFERVKADSNGGIGIKFAGSGDRLTRRFVFSNCQASSNTGRGVYFVSSSSKGFKDAKFFGMVTESNGGAGCDFDDESGTNSQTSFNGWVSNSNTGDGFKIDLVNLSMIACNAQSNGGIGYNIDDGPVTIVACNSNGNTGLDYDIDSDDVVFVANAIDTSRLGGGIPGILDYQQVVARDFTSGFNLGENYRSYRKVFKMYNNSGGTIDTGAPVVFGTATSGEEMETTTTQGDPRVVGVAAITMQNNTYGEVLVEGYTTQLDVDGTVDIAVGDLLGTFTTAEHAMKAASGDVAFAIALEAYTTNDSNGVIDALIITPRYVP